MKIQFISASCLVCIVVSSIPISGCINENESTSKHGHPLSDTEQILSAYNAGKFPQEQTKLFVGDGQIVTHQNEILIKADCPENDYISTYYLQVRALPTGLETENLGTCEFLFLGTTLIVNSLNQASTLAFSLSNNPNATYTKDIAISTEYLGYGLGESRAPRSLSNRDAPVPKCKCLDAATSNGEDCESGGHGSSSCSITTEGGSCSVTCTSGLTQEYFACADEQGTIGSGN